jgi:hypothetical protein
MLSFLLVSYQKTVQFLLSCFVRCATSSASCNLPVPPDPTIASVVVLCLLLNSLASASTSCTSQPLKCLLRKKGMIDGALPAPSTSVCSLLDALSCPLPYAVGIETPMTPSRQYTISSFLVVLRFLAHCICSDTVNWPRAQLRNAASGILVILCISWSSNALLPMRCPLHKKNSTKTGAISSCSVHPPVNQALAQNDDSHSLC